MKRVALPRGLFKVSAVTAVAVAAAAVASPSVASKAQVTEPQPSHEGAPVAGTLIATDQEPVVGAEVRAWWQSVEHTAGEQAEPVVMGAATTAKDGSYALDLEPTPAMLHEAAENGGWLNFFVSSTAGTGSTLVSVSRQVDLESGELLAPEEQNESAPVIDDPVRPGFSRHDAVAKNGVVGDPEDETVTTSISEAPELNLMLDVDSTTAAKGGMAPAATTFCTAVYNTPIKKWGTVMEFHKPTNAKASWIYGTTADTSWDVGLQVGGGTTWLKIGTHKTANTGQRAGAQYLGGAARNAYAQSQFFFQRYHYAPAQGYSAPAGTQCYGMPSHIRVGTKVRVPQKWVGGEQLNTNIAGAEFIGCPAQRYRTPYSAHGIYDRDSKKASRLGFGAQCGGYWVGAQSGFSENVQLKYRGRAAPGFFLCGTNAGPMEAGVVHAQNR